MPNDAELRRTGISFTRAFTRHRDVLAEPRHLPDRHVPLAPRRHAHDDRGRPVPRPAPTCPTCCARSARLARQRRGAARPAGRPRSCAGSLRLGPKSGNEPELPAGHRHARDAAARARLPRGVQGQVAPVEAGRRRRLERRGPGADRARLRLRRMGAAGRRRRRQGRHVRRRQRRHHARGLGRGLHAPGGALARPGGPARAVLPGRLARQSRTTCSATRPRSRRAATRRPSSATSACRCRPRSTRTCATSRRCTR